MGRAYETQELFDLREKQGRQLDAAPDLSDEIPIPDDLTGVKARAAELALRRAAEKIVAEDEYLGSYLDRCVNGRGPQLAINLLVASGDRTGLASIVSSLLDRNMNGQLRTSEVPLTVTESLSKWAIAVSTASELAQR